MKSSIESTIESQSIRQLCKHVFLGKPTLEALREPCASPTDGVLLLTQLHPTVAVLLLRCMTKQVSVPHAVMTSDSQAEANVLLKV